MAGLATFNFAKVQHLMFILFPVISVVALTNTLTIVNFAVTAGAVVAISLSLCHCHCVTVIDCLSPISLHNRSRS